MTVTFGGNSANREMRAAVSAPRGVWNLPKLRIHEHRGGQPRASGDCREGMIGTAVPIVLARNKRAVRRHGRGHAHAPISLLFRVTSFG